eukprot:COSAG02_NODE_4560_length_5216_cov_1.786594_1_plen_97_part_00
MAGMAEQPSLPELEFNPPPAIESPAGRRGPPGMVVDVTPPENSEGRESRGSIVLPTPQTVKVDRLGRRLDAADEVRSPVRPRLQRSSLRWLRRWRR